MPRALVAASLWLFCSAATFAQEPFNLAVQVDNLSSIFTRLYGPSGLVVDSLTVLPGGDTHSGHFNADFQSEFVQFGTALTSKLVSVPLPSLASGFTYEFDPSLGVFNRTTQSFGPILAERAETIGANRISFGFAFQRLSFDTIEKLDLDQIPAVFTHDSFELRGGRDDVVTTINAISATVAQFTVFLTYGLTDRLDFSLAVPFVKTDLTVISDARIQRLGTADPAVHFFRSLDGTLGDRRIFTASGAAVGMGDVTARLKSTLLRRGSNGVALGLDLRIPTGDQENLLGAGAPGVKPFLIWSGSFDSFSPHVNAGYLWNGSSVLAGDPRTGESTDLPDHATLVVGADFGVSSRVTFSLDFLGQLIIDAPRLRSREFLSLNGVSTFPDITFEETSFNEMSGAVGLKLNLFKELLVDFNLLFKLDDNGLRDKITPLVGLEYGL